METISVKWNGENREVIKGESLEEIIGKQLGKSENPVIVAKVTKRLRELRYIPCENDEIYTLDLSSPEGNRAYQRSLLHIFIRAVRESIQGGSVDVQHSMGDGIYCEVIGPRSITPFDLDVIERRMRKIVDSDEPFVREIISKAEAIALYKNEGQTDKSRLLEYRPRDEFKVYTCGGMSDYFYGYMAPSTGYIRRFKLQYQSPGLVLLFPPTKDPMAELVFVQRPKLAHVFRQSEKWADILNCGTVADLNDMVMRGQLNDFIRINEALHEKVISDIADDICDSGRRVVLVAGPSSSGKTTFTQRLGIQILVNGKKPVRISLDNYYIDRDKILPGDDGKVDLEDINTLDIALFNEHLSKLIDGEEVEIPVFNFKTGKREEKGSPFKINANQLIMIEGIHGLNNKLTEVVPDDLKFKIYISALTQLNLDHHNRIPTTDVRLIRRMVRDNAHRGASFETTIRMWPSVRAGESKWIFPFQEQCDVMFNSTLVYELLYLKKLAYPLLEAVPMESEAYLEANRLVKFLNYFIEPGSDAEIPRTSILREFIGNGCFEQ